jgi:signal transduction histidine kinase
VTIEVEDDGDGIAADVLPRVFEPHFSTRTSGSGLGLAISKRLVDAWGGSIQIGPATPRGTDAQPTDPTAPSDGTKVRVTLVPATSP